MHIIADIVGMPEADRAWVFSKTDMVMRSGDPRSCLLYTSDAADDLLCVDLGGRRIIKKKNKTHLNHTALFRRISTTQHTIHIKTIIYPLSSHQTYN